MFTQLTYVFFCSITSITFPLFFQSFTPRLPFTISQKFYFDMQDTFNPQGLFIAKILDVV